MIRLYTFLIVVAIVAIIAHVAFVMPKSKSVAQTVLHVKPNTALISTNADQVINDIVYLAQNKLSTERLQNIDNAGVNISRIEGHSFIQVTFQLDDQRQIRLAEKEVLRVLIKSLDGHYNYKSDFDISISNRVGAEESSIVRISAIISFILVALGVVAGILALISLMRSPKEISTISVIDGKKIFEQYQTKKQKEEVVQDIDEKLPVVQEEVLDIAEEEEEEKDLVSQDVQVPDGLPTIPGNLPVANLSNISFEGHKTEKKEEGQIDDKEPTEEELKARLNELLNGKL